MILNCLPPYSYDIPNPALGYLKGFLQSKGIPVTNVYWNLVLAEELSKFQTHIGDYPVFSSLSSLNTPVLYAVRHLSSRHREKTVLDQYFSPYFDHGKEPTFVDSLRTKIDDYIYQNSLHKESLAGFTLKTYQWLLGSHIMRRLKELNPHMQIVIGGLRNSEQAQTFMRFFTLADYAVWGEGEYPLFHLVQSIREGTFNEVPHLVYRDGAAITSTEKDSENCDLDSYPFADHTDYFAALNACIHEDMRVIIPIWGSRSCPWNRCKFCVLNEEFSYRARSPENIVEELEYQSRRYGCDTFVFVDTELPGNTKRFDHLLALIVASSERRGRPYCLFAEASPIFVNPDTVQAMKKACFEIVQIGFEAMTDGLLEKMKKRHSFAHNIQALKLGDQYGLEIKGNFIAETPPETEEDVLESCVNLKFLRFSLRKYSIVPKYFTLYKGSPYYNEMSEYEREAYDKDPMWAEVASVLQLPDSERFEFFGFFAGKIRHYLLWNTFQRLLQFYSRTGSDYQWTEYPDYSLFEEKGSRSLDFSLSRDETDVLVFCDSIKSFTQVQQHFSHLEEKKLLHVLEILKERGLLYCDRSLGNIISVVRADERVMSTELEKNH
ncbi:MAG: radical SAM protein [Theionarchaea archaeon]|nr:radical SAM protein [Theionarchaea archaeon]MBU7021474.1 radical SAM protein [Theionarchaea archaeon]MBU7033585.1 radical SAM protein [Theionarchaea archaeon]MBU7039605.1 radical SAM protein [Theionarchaea archaeon]